jgi:hypothetical protein
VLARLASIYVVSLDDHSHRSGEKKIDIVILSPLGDELVSLLIFHEFAMLNQSICELRIAANKLLTLERINEILAATIRRPFSCATLSGNRRFCLFCSCYYATRRNRAAEAAAQFSAP